MPDTDFFFKTQINSITKELKELHSMKKNLTNFAFQQTINGKLRRIDFQRIISEVESISNQIVYLESLRNDYNNMIESI